MKIEKSNRRIEITLRYGDPLQPAVKARKYKWDPDKKVWWKGYTEDEMAWAQAQLDGKKEAAARFAERRKDAVKLDASYKQTEAVKDDLLALGCFLDSTGERVFSTRRNGYVFAKAWYAPADKAVRAKAIIEHGGAAKADAAAVKAAEAKSRRDALNARLRDAFLAAGLPADRCAQAALGAWTADLRFGWATIYSADYKFLAVALHDTHDDSIQVLNSEEDLKRVMREKVTTAQMPVDQAEAARYGRTATGIRRNIHWNCAFGAKVGDVIHTKTSGWVLVVAIRSDQVTWSDIEAREDLDDFDGRQTPGIETHATVIPVQPTPAEVAEEAERQAARTIRTRFNAALAAMNVPPDDDRDLPRYEAEYAQAKSMVARLEAGEKATTILASP